MFEVSRIGIVVLVMLGFSGLGPGGALQAEELKLDGAEREHHEWEKHPERGELKIKPLDITAYWQNDSSPLHPNNDDDRHYTNGVGLKIAHQPGWADDLAEWMPFGREFRESHGRPRTAAGYFAGQLMFTPRDLTEEELIPDDRPYAGYLYGGAFWQRADEALTTLDHFQLEIGTVGSDSQADDTQQITHDWIDTVDPQGWDNQIGNEVTGQFYFRKKWRFRPWQPPDSPGLAWEVLPQAGFALGTVHRNLSADLTVRGGWNLPLDFGPDRLRDMAAPIGRSWPGFGVYGFARIGGKAVEHNIFLEGNNFRSSHSVDPEPLVGDAQLGAEARYQGEGWGVSVMYGQTWMTHEFKGQDAGDAYASLTVTLKFLF